jgi:hypothetical protein
MSTLIWKELRENLQWALLAMLVLGGAELYALYHSPDTFYDDGMTLTRASFLTATTFGPAIIGFCLGLLQILPELQRDRWAALLHRPMPRGQILLGKMAAGFLLYTVAVLPPFLLCVWLAATPGHFPSPFVPALALPGIADSAAGLVYYFAALVVALQRGGLAALRGIPLLAAIHVSHFVSDAWEFSGALSAVVLMAAVMCVAAWGAIHSMDLFGNRPWPGKVAFLCVAFFGICGAGDLATFVINSGRRYDYDRSGYEMSDADRPLKVSYQKGTVLSVQELDGSTPAEADFKPERIREHTRQLNLCSYYIGDSHQWHASWFDENYRSAQRSIRAARAYSFPQPEQWFYLAKERSFIGMSLRTKTPIGRLDRQGFQPASAKPIPLSEDVTFFTPRDYDYQFGAGGIKHINFGRRQITNLALPLPGPVSGVSSIYVRENSNSLIAAALSRGLAIYKQPGYELVTTLPYHQDVTRWGSVRIGSGAAQDKFYLRYDPSVWISKEENKGMPTFMEVVDAHGELLHSYTLPPIPVLPKPRRWVDSVRQSLQTPAFFFGGLLYQKVIAPLGIFHVRETASDPWGDNSPLPAMEAAIYITLLSLLCAGITLYSARRAQMSWNRAWAWAAFTLAFNLAGLLVFRLVADRPQLVPCTTCSRSRPVENEHCPHCARGWPPPSPTGTEIVDYASLNGFETKPTV